MSNVDGTTSRGAVGPPGAHHGEGWGGTAGLLERVAVLRGPTCLSGEGLAGLKVARRCCLVGGREEWAAVLSEGLPRPPVGFDSVGPRDPGFLCQA